MYTGMTCKTGCPNCPPERAAECVSCQCPGNKQEWCGGGCSMTVNEVVCSWGAPFTLLAALALALYVGGGVLFASRTKGRPMQPQSHPHWDSWQELRALVFDGMDFAKVRAGGGASARGRAGRGGGGKTASAVEPKKEKKAAQKHGASKPNEKKEKKERKAKERDSPLLEGADEGVPEAAAAAAAPSGPKATPSGGGGKWVHMPS